MSGSPSHHGCKVECRSRRRSSRQWCNVVSERFALEPCFHLPWMKLHEADSRIEKQVLLRGRKKNDAAHVRWCCTHMHRVHLGCFWRLFSNFASSNTFFEDQDTLSDGNCQLHFVKPRCARETCPRPSTPSSFSEVGFGFSSQKPSQTSLEAIANSLQRVLLQHHEALFLQCPSHKLSSTF